MNRIYEEAVATPGGVKPWAAVLSSDAEEINRVAADSREEAKTLVRYFLEKLAAYARRDFEDTDADRT